ncbi:MAG: hypothetical protein K2O33_08485, partial [Muribaculaceae bacterium]|nr:hypothetical protein [Muribaculaceae bacterium]
AVDGKAEEARGRVESLEYTHAVDMAELRDLLEGDPVKAAFIEHWITDIGGEYFKETDTFGFRRYVEGELYGPTDLTFAEARRSAWAQVRGGDITGADSCCGRLFLPPLNYINAGLSFHGTTLCYNDTEYMFLVGSASYYANVSGGGQTFRIGPMRKLRAVVGRLNITAQAADLSGCPLLELVRFGDLPSSVRLPDSPLLSDTALRWIAESGVPAGRSPVVELHPEAFARLTDAVLEEAASKNITFVTA